MYQVANFSKACREAKCLSVDVATFPFEIPENLPQQTTTYSLYLFLVCYVYPFFFSGTLLMNTYLGLTAAFFLMLYMDHWEGQEFKTCEPVSLSPFFI
jgi:hypothetical protein